ncbi:MAG: hypothetical protein EKK63_12690 [Acinetobacter sp.]|uniref:hypothetical protein n=1 Tax=Acinetobacter sp. TaxID=472 RepID=UPI000FC24404|nr:hypothetical protein [Acinetobacter sp.]RUP38231.1 MAG: hypothetical protein EKK63_12690 [Acinetobacter sp.]
MAFKIKNIIWEWFGLRDTVDDQFKDVNGKGINQRFNELLAEDFDDHSTHKINNIVEYTQSPMEIMSRFVVYREKTFGLCLISSDEYVRRKFIQYASKINNLRGTKWGYILLYRFMGFDSIVVNELASVSGFDSPTTFDDVERVFDRRCQNCTKYSIDLTGAMPMSVELLNFIMNVVEYNEPINAKLKDITYNGTSIVSGAHITMFIDANGNLIYNNPFDASFSAWIDGNGDLHFNSDNASAYSLDVSGDLIYTP